MNKLQLLLPFLGWPRLTGATLRADLIAGITVALILVPQSMAYAQLAGSRAPGIVHRDAPLDRIFVHHAKHRIDARLFLPAAQQHLRLLRRILVRDAQVS